VVNDTAVERPGISIMGDGTVGGGVVGRLRINGEGVINGDTDCHLLRCNGSAIVNGSLLGRLARVNGHLKVSDHVEMERIRINGSLDAGRNARISHIGMNGDLSTGMDLFFVKGVVNGTVTVQGNVEAEQMTVRGTLSVNGHVQARELNLTLIKQISSVPEIRSRMITVAPTKLAKLFHSSRRGHLNAERIVGEEIRLENTRASVVRGSRVHIGKGCTIDRVEYTETFSADAKAVVKDFYKIDSI
jgi:cytoskeletal protein CcmA (bactofilin family)